MPTATYSMRTLLVVTTVAAVTAAFVGQAGIALATRTLTNATIGVIVAWTIGFIIPETRGRISFVPLALVVFTAVSISGLAALTIRSLNVSRITFDGPPKFHDDHAERYKRFVFVGMAYGLSIGFFGSWSLNILAARRAKQRARHTPTQANPVE